MNVVLISPYLPARDGIADYSSGLRDALLADGHEVAVVPARPTSSVPAEVIAAVTSRGAARDVARRVEAADPDVIHLQFATAAYGGRMRALLGVLAGLRHIPAAKVVTMHEVTRDLALLGAVGRALYRRLAAWADRVVVHTEAARSALVRTGIDADRIERIPLPSPVLPAAHCTASDLRRRHDLGDRPVVLAFGFIHIDKGLPVLVRALADVCGDERETRLVVAGAVRRRNGLFRIFELNDRRHERYVRRLARRLGVADRMIFTGYVPVGEVAPWFDAADLAVLPYRRIEQSGVAALAAAAGRPVIVSDVGGLGEDASRAIATFPAGDAARLAELLSVHLDRRRDVSAPAAVFGPSVVDVAVATVKLYRSIGSEAHAHAS